MTQQGLSLNTWDQRWKDGQIQWHDKTPHKDLLKSQDDILFKANTRVFFPLCGKAVDMKYVTDLGHRAVGLEFSEVACHDFFTENSIAYESAPSGVDARFRVFSGGNVTLFCGDFFQATEELLGKFDSIWDRGSMVAVDPGDRSRYARVMSSLVDAHSRYFLQAISYDQSQRNGPPFSLPREQVTQLYGDQFDVGIREESGNDGRWLETKYTLTVKQ